MEYVIQCGLFVLGAAMGSFAAASVWRIRAAELRRDPALASTPPVRTARTASTAATNCAGTTLFPLSAG